MFTTVRRVKSPSDQVMSRLIWPIKARGTHESMMSTAVALLKRLFFFILGTADFALDKSIGRHRVGWEFGNFRGFFSKYNLAAD